jgi:hypothetical protein
MGSRNLGKRVEQRLSEPRFGSGEQPIYKFPYNFHLITLLSPCRFTLRSLSYWQRHYETGDKDISPLSFHWILRCHLWMSVTIGEIWSNL